MSIPTCSNGEEWVKKWGSRERKEPYNPDELTDIERRVGQLHQRLNAAAPKIADEKARAIAEQAKVNRIVEETFLRNVAEMEILDPRQNRNLGTRIDSMLANQFNQKNQVLGMSPSLKYTPSGEVRYSLLQAKNLAEGVITLQAMAEGIRQVRQVHKTIRAIAKRKGIAKRAADDLIRHSVEVGQIPKNKAVYAGRPEGEKFAMSLYDDFVRELGEKGFSQSEIDTVIQESAKITAAADEIRARAIAMGVDVGDIEGIGYFPRIMNRDAERILEAKKTKGTSPLVRQPIEEAAEIIKTSRKTYNYVPGDLTLMSVVTGRSVDELNDLLAEGLVNNRRWLDFLHHDLSAAQVDQLIDMGIMTKVLMPTRQARDYLFQQYGELPFKGIRELFESDPEKALAKYDELLKKAAGESAMMKTMVEEGLKKGWAITPEMKRADPDLYSDFVELPGNAIRRYYPQFKGDAGVLVHPVAHNSILSMLDLATDPTKQHTFATILSRIGKMMVQAMLITPQYVGRNLYQAVIGYAAAGGNLLRLLPAYWDVMRVQMKGLEALDDTRKIFQVNGEMITKRELYKKYILNRPSNLAPQLAETGAGTVKFEALNPLNIPAAIYNWRQYSTSFGSGADNAVRLVAEMQSEVFASFAAASSWIEFATKWGLIQSLADRSPMNRIAQTVSGLRLPRNFDSFDDMLRHMDEHLINWGDVGKTTKRASALVPFATWMLNNPPMMVRQIMRNPRAFINYMRVRELANADAKEDENYPEVAEPEWVQDSLPLRLRRVGDSWIVWVTNNIDPMGDFLSNSKTTIEALQALFGVKTGGTVSQTRQLTEDPVHTFFRGLVVAMHPMIQQAVEGITGKDLETGRPIDEGELKRRQNFLGVRLTGWQRHILASYPPLANLDRANPSWLGHPWGTPEIRDPRTGRIIQEGRTSWAGAERFERDLSRYDPIWQQYGLNIARFAGLQVMIIDPARGVQVSESQLESELKAIRASLGQTENELKLERQLGIKDQEEYDKRVAEWQVRSDQADRLQFELERIDDWARKNGVPKGNAIKEIQRRAVRNLPGLSEERTLQIVEEAIRRHQRVVGE